MDSRRICVKKQDDKDYKFVTPNRSLNNEIKHVIQ